MCLVTGTSISDLILVSQVLGTQELLPVILDLMMIILFDNDADYLMEFYLIHHDSMGEPPWSFMDRGSYDGRPAEEIWGMLMKAFPKHRGRPDTLCASQLLMLNQNKRKEYKRQYGRFYADCRRYHEESLLE
jgi:hypothetical protein